MYLMAVDDERLALDNLLARLREAWPQAEIKGFLRPEAALAEIQNGFCPDVVFLDMELCGMNGIVVAQRLQKVLPSINLIFISGSTDYPYMSDAFELHASGYLTKPVEMERLREELENLRYKPQRAKLSTADVPPDAPRYPERGGSP